MDRPHHILLLLTLMFYFHFTGFWRGVLLDFIFHFTTTHILVYWDLTDTYVHCTANGCSVSWIFYFTPWTRTSDKSSCWMLHWYKWETYKYEIEIATNVIKWISTSKYWYRIMSKLDFYNLANRTKQESFCKLTAISCQFSFSLFHTDDFLRYLLWQLL